MVSATEAINSPHDPEGRYSSKRSTIWVGYRVHLTESCDDDQPRVVTNVELTPAPIADTTMTGTIHEHGA
jgi:transposase